MMEEQLRLDGRTTADLIAEGKQLVDDLQREHKPVATFLLVSGGNDSMVVLDALGDQADAVLHVNTGIGIPETTEFVREQVAASGLPLIEAHPPVPYEELLPLFGGFPAPTYKGHRFFYRNLKERAMRAVFREHGMRRGWRGRFLLLSGIRKDESSRRMGAATATHRDGCQVWANPLLDVTNGGMAAYRAEHAVPQSAVAAKIHMSGECLCGSFAHPGEREELRFWFPEFIERIEGMEERARAKGLRRCEWGAKWIGDDVSTLVRSPGPLCSHCPTLWETS
jgi:3'-phosphoadenosine 5'-phosphosulfate sulfotransferase (PAPS reductase)/FAD synthetase